MGAVPAKDVMAAAVVPTAGARTCSTAAEVTVALDAFGPPYVVKDDGLAAGKGVVVTEDRDAARAHAAACRGAVVVEEFLAGPEVSFFCVTDGDAVLPLLPTSATRRATVTVDGHGRRGARPSIRSVSTGHPVAGGRGRTARRARASPAGSVGAVSSQPPLGGTLQYPSFPGGPVQAARHRAGATQDLAAVVGPRAAQRLGWSV